MEREEIMNRVKKCVGEVLLIEDEEQIKPDTNLIDDLGAESIDFVEIIHSLSRIFDVPLNRNEIYPDRDFFTDRQFFTEEFSITPLGKDKLANSWPHLAKEKINEYQDLTSHLDTLSHLVDYFDYKLNNAG